MALPQAYLDDPSYQKMEEVFPEFVMQGEGRKLTWLAERAGLPLTVVTRGVVQGQWMRRIQEIAQDAAKKSRDKLVDDVSGLNTFDVSRITELTDKAFDVLMQEQWSPTLAAKLLTWGIEKRREILGLGQGQEGDIVARMQKLLGASMSEPSEVKPFVLDRKKLEAPALPEMPGMTSDALDDVLVDEAEETAESPDD